MLGYDTKAQAEAKFAQDLSFQLPPQERSVIKGRFEEMSSDWDGAAATYRSLWSVYSDTVDYGLMLARAQTSGGKGDEALATLAAVRQLPPPSGQDPRIDLAEAYADDSISKFQQGGEAAARAAQKATQQGARNLVAQARLEQCWALGKLNQAGPAKAACEKAEDAFADVGDLLGRARSLTRLSDLAANAGDIDQALDLRTRALAIAKQVGSQKDVSGALMNLGNLQAARGELDQARKSLEDALAVAREIDFKKDMLDAENNLGTVFQSSCDFEKARDSFQQSRQTAEAIGDKTGVATAVYNLGSVLYVLGDLSVAQSQVQLAISQAKELGDRGDAVPWLMTLGDILMDQDDLAGAAKAYQDAKGFIADDEKGGQALPGPTALYTLEMAGLNLEKGQVAEAEKLARRAVEYFQGVKDAANEAGARTLLARALMAENRLPGAAQEVERAQQVAATDCGVRLPLAITKARTQAHTGQVAAARQGLESVLNEVKAKKLQGYELEARLAQAEIELQSGDEQRARSELKALQNDATVWRFKLVARKARELAQAGKDGAAAGR
jgi:tetratricopeptide (TPR) repeat protein